ncbi:hypothetical protein HNP84_004126 [Thermocatellispora tengchongensis]|uniref:DUF7144 domain-containing protein n=1 Tax=Thermocatellispora tengchongensis TaxID=1073253 RepID=A0A840NZP4_9ACTN|nr:hypothetical protein [Thermocatellispora tengchongensis]MBB5134394.1 hypothetical protein [Thermocatellispora tengchongensis]
MTYQARRHVTGWVGWVWFAGLMMIMSGVFNAISGLYAIFKGDFYIQTARRLLLFDLTAWGWVHLLLGVLLVVAGVAVSVGQTWARVVAAVLVMINAITQLIWITINPWWSLAVIALDVVILYALIVHGREAAEAGR